MPVKMHSAQAAVINGEVYVGGGDTESKAEGFLVCRYNPVKNEWNTLPRTPVKWFGIGHLDGKLVLVGGMLQTERRTALMHVFEDNQQWENSIPAMPVPRSDTAVLSHNSTLVVCGGRGDAEEVLATIFVYSGLTSQWTSTGSLPSPCWRQSSTVIGNSCFFTGGYSQRVDPFPGSFIPVRSVISLTLPSCSALQMLPLSLYFYSSIATMSGSILLVGGSPKVGSWNHMAFTGWTSLFFKGFTSSEIFVYSPNVSSWIHIGDLPAPQTKVVTATLPSGELLVMGGGNREGDFSSTVFMGSINKVK